MGVKIVSKINIAVIGCGAWGTTLAKICQENDNPVMLWCHSEEISNSINFQHENKLLLPGVELPEKMKATTDIYEACEHADAFIFVIPSPYLDSVKSFSHSKLSTQPILTATKAFLSEEKGHFVSHFLNDVFKNNAIASLSGPNLAKEVANRKPAASVVASDQKSLACLFQDVLSNDYFRLYRSNDVVGVECGGVLKNSIAIASGYIDGLQIGENTKAALITRSIQEIKRFGMSFGAKEETFYGLSGFGDLMATCHSNKSRNWQVGYQFSKGKTLDDIIQQLGAVAEGVYTTKTVVPIAREKGIEMPIISEVFEVLFNQKDPRQSISDLMSRNLKAEHE